MKPTLLILAAGMGSRYGGLKQLDTIGPSGETIMDYSVYDAIRAGFGKVVFVIRHSFEQEFYKEVISKFEDKIEVKVVFQEISSVPQGSVFNPEREKPWGTNHAVLMAKDVINEPFGVINADDFYGRESFEILASFLKSAAGKTGDYCMVAYRLGNTLSENGFVSRGECFVDENDLLTGVTERTKIIEKESRLVFQDADNQDIEIDKNTPVSMNFWGFTPDYFEHSQKSFVEFLAKRGNELKSEFYIPTMVNDLIASKTATCKVIKTPAQWFGVTYSEDRESVVEKISLLVGKNIYPQKLWK
ncbi:MAG: nucleotidyltransferase [Prevotellaceae bacterium]|jgi:hypothetical protein|nr:nucleotidyltransferase [Prevotellaceae bacterium]